MIDFALIEGYFDKGIYGHAPLSAERFLAVCGMGSPLTGKAPLPLEELCAQPIVVREPGSGTREVLENLLHEHNLSLSDFRAVSEIGNFRTLKQLVAAGPGITFAYAPAVQEELAAGLLREIPLKGVRLTREFSFVWLKDSLFDGEREDFRRFCETT